MSEFKNKKITIMGLGLHGGAVAVVRYLAKRGAILTVTDLKTKEQLKKSLEKLKGLKVKYVLGKHLLADFQKADLIIQNPDVPRESKFIKEAKKNKIPIENEASLFFKLCLAPIIAITGTRGKSTTTDLLYHILKKDNPKTLLAGNIKKVVLFEIVDKVKQDTPVVLELSSWQLELLAKDKISPQIGVLTNVMRDHMNRYKKFSDYVEAKKIIYKFQTKQDYVVLNKENKITQKLGQEVKSQRFWFAKKFFSAQNGSFVKDGYIYFRQNGKQEKVCPVSVIKLLGEHNLENVLAAVTVAKIKKIPNSAIISVLKKYQGLASRLQLIKNKQGIKYYNDTTATTPDAVVAALKTLNPDLKSGLVLLAGGKDKKLNFKEMAQEIKKRAKALILFEGTATAKIFKELKKINFNKTIVFVESMPEAFTQAKYILQKGDIFLLSPGAASFGLFINEYDRGDQFNAQVKKIK